jgi:hypothetical protein
MNNKLRTFRGDARRSLLYLNGKKLNMTLMSLVVLFLMSSVNTYAIDYTLNGTWSNGTWSNTADWAAPNGAPSSNTIAVAGWELKYNYPKTGEVSIEYAGASSNATALHFDGSNDEVSVNNLTAFDIGTTSDLLVTATVKVTNASTRDPLFSNMDVSGTTRGYQIWVDAGGKIELEWKSSALNTQVTGTTAINDGTCHDIKVEVIRSTGTVNIYIDNVLDVTSTNAGFSTTSNASPANAATPVYIGSERTNNGSYLWNGEIDDLKVTIGGVLTGSWDFNQGLASGNNAGLTTLTDNSGNGNDGTLQNFALTGASSNWITSTCSPVAPASFATGFNASAICADATE